MTKELVFMDDDLLELLHRRAAEALMTPNEIRERIGLDPIKESSLTRQTNCKNCGAPLSNNGRCEYCGTQY